MSNWHLKYGLILLEKQLLRGWQGIWNIHWRLALCHLVLKNGILEEKNDVQIWGTLLLLQLLWRLLKYLEHIWAALKIAALSYSIHSNSIRTDFHGHYKSQSNFSLKSPKICKCQKVTAFLKCPLLSENAEILGEMDIHPLCSRETF